MEDASHPGSRTLKVERGVEWSRLERQTMRWVYEYLVPIVGARIQPACDGHRPTPGHESTTGMQNRALGA